MIRRMLRGYLAHVILMGLPLALITILGLVAGNAVDSRIDIPFMDIIAITQVFAFQFFGGFYTMEFIKSDLIESTKWRLYSLPYSAHEHAFSIILSTSIFNMLQGLVIIIFTHYVYDVYWGNMVIVMLTLLAISILSQLVFLNCALGIKNYKTAERAGTAYGLISITLGGVWFTMPDIEILNFIITYINPFSLGVGSTHAVILGNMEEALLNIGILIIEAVIMGVIAIYIGRRKLA
jgi:ABC-2 type transport system permease protein